MDARIDQFLTKWKRNNSPGVALAVVQSGEVVIQRNFGQANLDYGIPISSKTVFRVASLAKQFTAACIGLLEEEGVLSLKDNIRAWIPELPQYDTPITLEQLLWHTSGLNDFPHLLWGLSGRSFGDAVTQEGLLDILCRNRQTDFQPGTRHMYCNTGYFLLGVVVARCSGQSLAQYARKHIFAPLGMNNTHFQDDYTRVIPNRAIGYAPRGDGFAIFDSPTTTLVGDDGLFTTLEDMLIWEENFYANKLGKGSLMERMLQRGKLKDDRSVDYGYGLFIHERKGLDLFWHYGEYLGFQSVIRSFPRQRLSIICLANTSELAPIEFARELEDILLEEHCSTPAVKPHTTAPGQEPADLSMYLGLYCNCQEGFTIEVRAAESGLQMVINSKSTLNLTLVAGGRAEASGMDSPLGLEFTPNGKAISLFDDDMVFPLEPLATQPQHPTPEDLAQLAGAYYSPILDTTWVVTFDGEGLRLVNKDRNRVSPQGPLSHVFEDFYIAQFDLWRRKIRFLRENGRSVAMLVLNGDSSPTRFTKLPGGSEGNDNRV